MNTTENNKIIVDFLQWEKEEFKLTMYYYTIDGCTDEEGLKFHNDWNWLIQVVEKIESQNFENEAKDCISFMVKIINTSCQIIDIFKDRFQIQTFGNTKIEAVYQAVVVFIEWYNKQKL